MLKYLQLHLGKIYFLSESDHFGLLLFHLLRRPVTDARRDHVLEEFEECWPVALGAYGCGKRGLRGLTGKSVYQFNNFVHALVLAELHAFVELAIDHGQQAKFAIEAFMLKYGFAEEDIQFAALQKSWTRHWAVRKASRKRVASLTGLLHVKDLEKRLKNVPVRAAVAA